MVNTCLQAVYKQSIPTSQTHAVLSVLYSSVDYNQKTVAFFCFALSDFILR